MYLVAFLHLTNVYKVELKTIWWPSWIAYQAMFSRISGIAQSTSFSIIILKLLKLFWTRVSILVKPYAPSGYECVIIVTTVLIIFPVQFTRYHSICFLWWNQFTSFIFNQFLTQSPFGKNSIIICYSSRNWLKTWYQEKKYHNENKRVSIE